MSSVYCMHRRYIVVFAIRNLNKAEGDYEPTVVCLERVHVQNAWRLGAVRFCNRKTLNRDVKTRFRSLPNPKKRNFHQKNPFFFSRKNICFRLYKSLSVFLGNFSETI